MVVVVYNEEPDWVVGSGWQQSDSEHPAGTGKPAYRAVYKTLRVVFEGDATFDWPNLSVRFRSGTVDTGGFAVPNAFPWRRPGHLILPEFGALQDEGDARVYKASAFVNPNFQAWNQTTPEMFYVEFILEVEATRAHDKIVEGRRKLASMKTLLDLRFGNRVLGCLIAEEAGERFPDGHFNRELGSERVGWEPQLEVVGIDVEELRPWALGPLDRHVGRPDHKRRRWSLAAVWYQAAASADDPVIEFLSFWFAIEVLVMDGSNIVPVRERVAALTTEDSSDWAAFIGRLYRKRGDLVHGDSREVSDDEVGAVRALVELLLVGDVAYELEQYADNLRQYRAGASDP